MVNAPSERKLTRTHANVHGRGGPQQPQLTVNGLKKYFPIRGGLFGRTVGKVQALDDVSFSVEKGKVLGVVGESGCGKSTLARLLMLLVKPDEGEMIFDGELVSSSGGLSVRELRRHMQMVFQDSYSSLNPRMSIAESIAFAPRMHGVGAAEAGTVARDLLQQVGLSPLSFSHRYPHELSGGQRQRVNIARALAVDPQLVILDEAVSALDKSVEAQVLNLLVSLQEKRNLTYIFISHDLDVVRYISDRVAVMYLGQIVEVGTADDIYERARHPYTRALIASAPSLDPRNRTRDVPLFGDPPNPINPPTGCRFRTRCSFAEDVCSAVMPKVAAAGYEKTHGVRCHMADSGSGHSRHSMS
ncbi:ABC transporter ATP-binding protein [Mesorhizobium sp. M7A.F.Ca.US.006.01.1.1]|uniref:ABC transporter ATP-binding protein n=1 Tax=Mesorhizobium sp. M7A.F.Ca.US.006.01.1.1 TaxID=2496707 RepID=UPI000FCCD0BF|nr:ABC transporter ATP-binding protein [Mesorhizobium sp. M7A.F.Ca.US.006.01.1.1]RUZ71178.1 ABC transporter ATP-binding protein [Mesorhizobium sp. M7A.F.Ca.US.006.01.1.1]